MLHKLPRDIPPLSILLDDIGRPHPAKLARALGVTERTIYRWVQLDHAPRPVLLSLFWLTRWGVSIIDADLYNGAQLNASYVLALKQENGRLLTLLSKTGLIADFGSANDPSDAVRLSDSRRDGLERDFGDLQGHRSRPSGHGQKDDDLHRGRRIC